MSRFPLFRHFILVAALAICAPVQAQDADTLLLLPFDNSLIGHQGEVPTQSANVTYVTGMKGLAAYLGTNNVLRYLRQGNLNAQEGSLEFWIKPSWNGGNGQTYIVLTCGGGGGLLFAKDGANNLRSIFNRYSVGGQPEYGVATNIGTWTANQWRHVAFTWSNVSQRLRMFIDGSLRNTSLVTGTLPALSDTTFQIGAEGASGYLLGALDELRISSIERTPNEIAQRYLDGLTITSLTSTPSSLTLMETWRRTPSLSAVTNLGTLNIPPTAATWTTFDPAVATVSADGMIRAEGQGNTVIRAAVGDRSVDIPIQVKAPVRAPEFQTIDPFLSTPAAHYAFPMPVAVIRYLPTKDGVNVDSAISGFSGSINSLLGIINQYDLEVKYMLEEGSRFRGYKDPSSHPSLGYKIVTIINVFEEMPPDMNPSHAAGSGVYFPDYEQIITRFNSQNLVETLGVKEFWLWGYHHGNIVPAESNMSSPTTGDVSNSYRFQDDLPVYNSTYVLYNYNFTRTSNEAVHNHGHQLESILSHANYAQTGNGQLFWNMFTGRNSQGQAITGRCGNTHMPPNTTQDYDYWNLTLVSSDIEDWTPANTGQQKMVNANTWGNLPYNWPYGRVPSDLMQHHWYIYWMQSMPGRNNAIPYGSNSLTNWWLFTAHWDDAIKSITPQQGLYAPNVTLSGTITLEDCFDQAQTVDIELRPESGNRLLQRTAVLGTDGTFALGNVPRGRYTLAVKGDTWLRKTVAVDLGAGDVTGITMSLKNGDVDGDNAITVFDYSALSDAFDSVPGDSHWLLAADLDKDGAVTVFDYEILSNNFDEIGEP